MSESLKVLNLYAGIGGNRKLWDEIVDDLEVTAVEIEEEIAKVYSDRYREDEVVIGDAMRYLQSNFKKYDFIWSSPPCKTHSRVRMMGAKTGKYDPVMPDMDLYSQILFLKHYFNGKWCVENVNSFYEPLIKPQKIQRHYFWANFYIPEIDLSSGNIDHVPNDEIAKYYGVKNLDDYKFKDNRKDQTLRNCVHPKLGKHILGSAYSKKVEKLEAFC